VLTGHFARLLPDYARSLKILPNKNRWGLFERSLQARHSSGELAVKLKAD